MILIGVCMIHQCSRFPVSQLLVEVHHRELPGFQGA